MNEKIIVCLHALNWMMGEVAYFDITLSGDGELFVSWGDGRESHYRPLYKNDDIRVEHEYGRNAKVSEQHFSVSIECTDATIRKFHTGCIDIAIDDIDFSGSPSLESLNMSGLDAIDLSSIKELKHLVCQESSALHLDLRSNTNLETLDCSYSKVQKLILSRCDNLREINCTGCYDLRDIAISNNSHLSKITLFQPHKIKSNSWKYVEKTIKRNQGEIVFL